MIFSIEDINKQRSGDFRLSPPANLANSAILPTAKISTFSCKISLHINAAGDGTRWHTATGWSCYTCKGQTESDRLADCLYKAAEQILENQVIRTDYARDGDSDWEENFYILRHTLCPAVLTENFFMDNKSDLEFLQSQAGKQTVIDTHVEGIIEYLSSSAHKA